MNTIIKINRIALESINFDNPTQVDADKFNTSSRKPKALSFEIKK